jgi:hypothetical protein
MSYTLTSSSTTLTFSNPVGIVRSIGKKIETYNFPSGNEKILDKGKTGDTVTLTGILYTGNPFDLMKWTNTVADNSEVVTVSDLGDTTLNKDYLIVDIAFNQVGGTVERYNYSLVLMKKYDDLG